MYVLVIGLPISTARQACYLYPHPLSQSPAKAFKTFVRMSASPVARALASYQIHLLFRLARLSNLFGYRVRLTSPDLPTATTGARPQSLDQLGWARLSRSGLTSVCLSTIDAGMSERLYHGSDSGQKSDIFHHLPGQYP